MKRRSTMPHFEMMKKLDDFMFMFYPFSKTTEMRMDVATRTNPETMRGTPMRAWSFLVSSRLSKRVFLVFCGLLFIAPASLDPTIPEAKKVPMNTHTIPSRKRTLTKVVGDKRKKTKKLEMRNKIMTVFLLMYATP
jgi:hypothetical protein